MQKWLDGVNYNGPGKSLQENDVLWSCTKPLVEMVKELMDEFGYEKETFTFPPQIR